VIKPENTNSEFELGGINQMALVCADMAKTVGSTRACVAMPLVKSARLPAMRQHFSSTQATATAWRVLLVRPKRATAVPGYPHPAPFRHRRDRQRAVGVTENHRRVPVPARNSTKYRRCSDSRRRASGGARAQPRREPGPRVSMTLHPARVRALGSTLRTPTASPSSSPAGPSGSPKSTTVTTPKTEADRRHRWLRALATDHGARTR